MLGNGNSIPIGHIGIGLNLKLNNLLHVPNLAKNSISIKQLCIDNSVYAEFHSIAFYAKDLSKRTILLEGGVNNGLSQLQSLVFLNWNMKCWPRGFDNSTSLLDRHFIQCNTTIVDGTLWHHKLDHPQLKVVHKILPRNNMSANKILPLRMCFVSIKYL